MVFEDYTKMTMNKLLTGYSIIICNPINHERLMKENPDVSYTVSRFVQENEVICLNEQDLYWRG